MPELTNPWVGYFDRSYEQIKKSLLTRLGASNPEITDHSEGNLLVIIIGMFAGVAEMLGLYIDTFAREAYLPTARRFSSVVKLVKSLDYRIKSYTPATVDLTITFLDSLGNPKNLVADYAIPAGTRFRTANGTEFISINTIIARTGRSTVTIPTAQKVKVTSDVLGTTTGLANQEVSLLTQYANGSMVLSINSEEWELVDTLGLSGPLDKHFVIDINEDRVPYILFGNGTNGKIPTNGYDIIGTYYVTEGANGNLVNPETINTIITVLTMPSGITSMSVTNTLAPAGGSDIETIEQVKRNAPLSIRTLSRAVTPQDYRDLIKMAPGVLTGDIKYCCGKCITIYIVPIDGSIASLALRTQVEEYFRCLKMVTTCHSVKAAGITPIILYLTVYGKYRQVAADIQSDIEEYLTDWGSAENQGVNALIAKSDIIAGVDNLFRVDRVEIDRMFTEPYARPINNETQLNWQRVVQESATEKVVYRLIYSSSGNVFTVYRGETLLALNASIGVDYIAPDIEFKINAGSYNNGDEWNFTIYPYNETIQLDDFTLPMVVPGTIVYNIIETQRDGKCDTDC